MGWLDFKSSFVQQKKEWIREQEGFKPYKFYGQLVGKTGVLNWSEDEGLRFLRTATEVPEDSVKTLWEPEIFQQYREP